MKKLVILLGAFSVSLVFACKTDLVNTKITCGNYQLSPASTAKEIAKNCNLYEEHKHHLAQGNYTKIEFASDQYKSVECNIAKEKLEECYTY